MYAVKVMLDSQKRRHIPIPTIPMFSGWKSAVGDGVGVGSPACAASMSEEAAVPRSPRHLHKRRRLSRLLDKLAVQIRNNNDYPPPPWHLIDAPYDPPKDTDDVPLDLSIKSEISHNLQPKLEPIEKPDFVCNTCGQIFSVHDRLAKHIASRHRGRTPDVARAYECEICQRRFARSDMLTRHARLHSGLKPYSCAVCGQVFSRSDHLSTHQRTHTGEKPYRCPVCPYAACRRDMITRHMRTHNKRAQIA